MGFYNRYIMPRLINYLCSEDAGFITGQDVVIDGGWCAQ